jgi:uncharacterized protein YjbI with pentapeptide repeats
VKLRNPELGVAVKLPFLAEISIKGSLSPEETAEAFSRVEIARKKLSSANPARQSEGVRLLKHVSDDYPLSLGGERGVIEALCGYLREPFELLPAGERDPAWEERSRVRLQVQELIERLLAANGSKPKRTRDVDINLQGAVLFGFGLGGCVVRNADFSGATFIDYTHFRDLAFLGHATFDRAVFDDLTCFKLIRFAGRASFSNAISRNGLSFDRVSFSERASFTFAVLEGSQGCASFQRVRFKGQADFSHMIFGKGWSRFSQVCFDGPARFRHADFGEVWFDGETPGRLSERERRRLGLGVIFKSSVDFTGARFRDDTRFIDVRFDCSGAPRVGVAAGADSVISFRAAIFEEGVAFYDPVFKKTVDFGEAWFGVRGRKSSCCMRGRDGEITHRPASKFERSAFRQGASFSGAFFAGDVGFDWADLDVSVLAGASYKEFIELHATGSRARWSGIATGLGGNSGRMAALERKRSHYRGLIVTIPLRPPDPWD